MKHTLAIFLLILASSAFAQSQSQNQVLTIDQQTDDQRAAKSELNLAARAYMSGKFAEAQRHSERALQIDPSNKTALILIARSIHAQYRPGVESPENIARAREAIAAYQRVSTDPNEDEAYNAVKELYGAIDENDLQYAWVMQRAISFGLPTAKRVDAYIDLALLDLRSSKKTSEEISERLYSEITDKVEIANLHSATRNEIARGQELASRGLQMARQTIALDPDNDSAWTSEVELLLSIARLFELEGNDSKAEQCRAQADEVATRASSLKIKREEAARARMVTVDCGVLCDKVISTPTPPYPAIGRTARAQGAVVVQIEIDEDGNVISATAISGHPLLRAAAVQAARLSTFSRTQLAGQPVKVNGSLIYNFTLP